MTTLELSLSKAVLQDIIISNLDRILQLECEMLSLSLSASGTSVDYVFKCGAQIVGIMISETVDPDEIKKILALLKRHFESNDVSLVVFLTKTPNAPITIENMSNTKILATSAICRLGIQNLTG